MPTGNTPTDALALSTFIKDYGPAIAWLLVIIGWWITSNQADHREKRKEIRAELDRLAHMIRQLVEDHRLYFTSPPQSAEESKYAVAVKAAFRRISMTLERQSARLDLVQTQSLFSQFYELITGGEFETTARQVRASNDHSFIVATSFAERIIDAMERAFLARFP